MQHISTRIVDRLEWTLKWEYHNIVHLHYQAWERMIVISGAVWTIELVYDWKTITSFLSSTVSGNMKFHANVTGVAGHKFNCRIYFLRVVLNVAITCLISQRMRSCLRRVASYTRRFHLCLIRRIVWWGSTMRMLNSFHWCRWCSVRRWCVACCYQFGSEVV